MIAEVISIGDELTSGQRLDTNSQWLAERLGELGVRTLYHATVADDLAANVRVFREAIDRADVIVVTGGLGPTADDLTRQALAEAVGVPLVQDDAALAHIRSMFALRRREMPPANVVQAQFPQGSRVVHNPHGTAPGIDLEIARPGRTPARVFCLPGVPAEMKEMWSATVGPAISAAQPESRLIRHKRIKCFGVGESDLEAMLPDLIRRGREPSVGITVSEATITLRITASGRSVEECETAMKPTAETIRQCLGNLVFGEEDDELHHAVIRELVRLGETLNVYEVGTGGLVTCRLNEVPGAADVFLSGTVLNELPPEVTGEASFEKFAEFARKTADWLLLIGPFPTPDEQGPGEVRFAVSCEFGTIVKSFAFTGHPKILRSRMAKIGLNLLRLSLATTHESSTAEKT